MQDYLKLHFIVLIWGFTAILGALIHTSALGLVFYRTLLASIALAIICHYKKKQIRKTRRQILTLLASGALVGMHWISFFLAIKISHASVALVGLSTATLWSACLEPFFNKKKISKTEIFLGIIVIAALYLIAQYEMDSLYGLLIGIFSAFLAASFALFNQKFIRAHHQLEIAFFQMVGACTLAFISIFVWNYFYIFEKPISLNLIQSDFIYLIILSLICTVYPYTECIELLKRMSVFVVSLSINLEPIYGMILAALILQEHEKLNRGFYFGAFLLVISVGIYPMLQKFSNRKPRLLN